MVRLSSEERKNEIILAAMPVFAEKGLHATTTKEIAKNANVSEALLYKHFKSKEEIYSHIKDFCCAGSHEVALNLLSLPKNKEKFFLSIFAITFFILQGVDGKENSYMTRRLILFSLLAKGNFSKDFFEARLDPFINDIDEGFNLLEVGKDRISVDIKFKDMLKMCHHFLAGYAFYDLPENKILNIKMNPKKQIIELCMFMLRGMGVTPSAIEKYFKPNEFIKLMNIKF